MSTIDTGLTVRFAEDVSVGDQMAPEVHRPTEVQLFRYCATTWNSHRIHFDRDYAASEGYPNVLVQSHLHGAFLTSLCTGWAGETGRVVRLGYSVRRFACPGDALRCEGTVTGLTTADGGVTVSLELREVRESDGVVCAQGEADVYLPARNGAEPATTA
ncbi:acyl dehydratase [Mycolicibacterium goodii]|uniref:acyl dehydratase n=1 Tax=Mycolicibacterium goodii TaxID=134601 RepID=UPI0006735F26